MREEMTRQTMDREENERRNDKIDNGKRRK